MLLKELEIIAKNTDEEFVYYQIDNLKKKIKDLESNTRYLLNLTTDISKSDLDIMRNKIHENREQIDKHECDIQDLEATVLSVKEKKRQLKDLKKLSESMYDCIISDSLDYETKTQICRLLIDKVNLDGDRVEIHMYIPIQKTPKRSQDNKTKALHSLFENTAQTV